LRDGVLLLAGVEAAAAEADERERAFWRFDRATPMAIPAISHP
jgi:hypothetical protein